MAGGKPWISPAPELHEFLRATAPADLAETMAALAEAARGVAALVRRGPIAGALGAAVGVNSDGEAQKHLDLYADRAFEQALSGASVRALASEERADVTPLKPDGKFLVALDPLDGSSNIEINITIGTIFSVLDAPATPDVSAADFLQPGHAQRAAGVALYGPQTSFIFTTGSGTHVATPRSREPALPGHQPEPQHPRGAQRVRDQHVELAPLAGNR